jgi:hypothetical protein
MWFRAVLRALGWDLDGDILMLGHLKLHTVGDVKISHSLGIDFGCAGYESDYDNNTDGWYD